MTTKTHELKVEGMSCNHCVKTVDAALRHVPGVVGVQVAIGSAKVETDATVTREALIAALADADYASN